MTKFGWEIEALKLGWDKSILFSDLSLSYNANKDGAALPIMGPSGQGKSTLLYFLAGYKKPINGKITWYFPDNQELQWSFCSSLDKKSTYYLRRKIFGFSFQNNTLHPFMTVKENLLYPLCFSKKSFQEKLKIINKTIDDFLTPSEKEFNKRKVLLDAYPYQLSGGQKQRIALAKAIMHNPKVLFADEPTGQLDIRSRKQVMGKLKKWLEDGFCAQKNTYERMIIWVSHHHTSDLDLMNASKTLFVENHDCQIRDKNWLANWGGGDD